MKTIKELKKGDKVLLSYGDQNGDFADCANFDGFLLAQFHNTSFTPWTATLRENPRRPTIVYCEVNGWEKELGDVYAHQIIGWWDETQGTWAPIQHTQKQLEMRKVASKFFL